MKKKSRHMILLLILLIFAAAVAGWWKYIFWKKDASPTGPATAQVSRRDFSSTVLATGAVKSQVGSEVKVGARISGKVIRLFANIGDFVKQGQVIAELEKEDLTAKIDCMAFGGGFGSVPLMFHEIVEVRSWIDGPTFLNGIVLGHSLLVPL